MLDVIVIGAGVMGAAVSRELSKYNLKVMVLDKENDVSNGTTKANSAIVHAGYDAKEGTLMAKYNVLGAAMYEELSKEIGAPYKKVGSYVLAFSEEEKKHIETLYERGIKNGVPELKLIGRDEILEKEPNINKNVVGALYAGTAGITGPWEFTIKLLENAALNGTEVLVDAEVINIEKSESGYKVILKDGREFETKIVINAAGVYADKINDMVSKEHFDIHPRIGEYYVLDKVQGKLVNSVLFQCPTEMGKGVLVTRTVHGNIMVGPTAEDVEDRDYVGTTTHGLDDIRRQAAKTIENINYRDSIRNFTGIRAESSTGDFIIGEASDAKGFYNIAGTKSPGLSSAPAIGVDVANMIVEKLGATKKEVFKQNKPQIHFIELSPEEKAEVIKKDPRYGRIICRCESITEGEIVDVIHRMVGAKTVDGVKKRCRPGTGRCQGGFCGPRVQEILARELGKELNEIVLDKKGAYILTNETKISK
ncbi:MAG: NAD(P)/FAD-dependent oxidoreductase [Fusobacterium perfoetens]|uniref:NAD(P)/FAD-dependent oxidoreductase n=1 Tax=Fusobacterium perfoetens TaxID=852 RepID=UPI0023F52302|nr:NAD(P)/FAD-dependent oxidoreductase [Fusobacterium perfoetens]MCI6152696.1 NAD(P)/FAD-dependent oxidoreductase [Fusobacterium perfoetens]MDY3236590.1 NAD(P)/FAD-dependent oxidoreductase [Fusobacterium perfoetens]